METSMHWSESLNANCLIAAGYVRASCTVWLVMGTKRYLNCSLPWKRLINYCWNPDTAELGSEDGCSIIWYIELSYSTRNDKYMGWTAVYQMNLENICELSKTAVTCPNFWKELEATRWKANHLFMSQDFKIYENLRSSKLEDLWPIFIVFAQLELNSLLPWRCGEHGTPSIQTVWLDTRKVFIYFNYIEIPANSLESTHQFAWGNSQRTLEISDLARNTTYF